MPNCTRAGLDKKADSLELFKDEEKVFYCELTKEIFRNYEDYFQRVMLLNSTIWSCAETGKQNLTYAEALKSERKARKTGENLSNTLKAPALMLVETQKQTSFRLLLAKIFTFIKDRLFKDEEIIAPRIKTKHSFYGCKVIQIITPKEVPADGVFDPKSVKYKVQRLDKPAEIWIITAAQSRRRRGTMNSEILKSFLKEHIIISENTIRVRPESYEKYVTSKNITFETYYVGKMPKWEPGKKFGKGLVQATIGNYMVHDAVNKQKELENLREAMERMRREKEEKLAEQEKKRVEMLMKIEEEACNILRRCDDLERFDQRIMPLYKPVKTIVASKYFSEFLMIQEFLHSFAIHLSASDVFRKNITFQQMCRAFLLREVAGPLSDILQVLLSTIFALQIEENSDCTIVYVKSKRDGLLWETANRAVGTHQHVSKYFSANMFELPIDAQTLTEILRLHLLSSGAPNAERSEAYRYQYRNGYSVTEDPGLLLRIQYPHILRAMKMYTIYQLPFKDILKVVNCLMDQIMTYNPTIMFAEERLENLGKVRYHIRTLIGRENKRVQNLLSAKKKLTTEIQEQIAALKEDDEKRGELERSLARKLKDMDVQDSKAKGNFEYELAKMNSEMFDYMMLLGTDRAHRNYYVFDSLPGLFIEHRTEEEPIPCLENPPKNDDALAMLSKEKHKLKAFFMNRYKQHDKENMKKGNDSGASVLPVNGEVVKVNGSANLPSPAEKEPPTPLQLYMCSGDAKNCVVHDPKHPARNPWSYINTKQELEMLIESLNPHGIRESYLRESIIKNKSNIIPHLLKCPTQMLSVDLSNREESMNLMLTETQKKYANSNFGFDTNADINEVMHKTLTLQIIEFERDITNGNLGKMKVSDLEKWRKDLSENMYSSQCKHLNYGPEQVNGNDKVNFIDPGQDLGDTLDVESEDSGDECVSVHDSPSIRQHVKNLASALLQIEQSIERKFLKEPFGLKVEPKDKNELEIKLAAALVRLKYWELSLMSSTSYSQIFLHLNILSDTVKWNKSIMKSSCLVCRRKGDADKLLLCDQCNAGTHMFCLKPKMKKVPEGNWYCSRCELSLGLNPKEKPKKQTKKVFSMDDDEDEKDKKTIDFCDDDDDPIKVESHSSNRSKRQSVGGKRTSRKTAIQCSDGEEQNSPSDDEPLKSNARNTSRNKKQLDGRRKKTTKVLSDSEDIQDENSNNSDDEPLKIVSKKVGRNKKSPTVSRNKNGRKRNSSSSDDEDNKPLITSKTDGKKINAMVDDEDDSNDDEDDRPLITNGNAKKKQHFVGDSEDEEDVCKICNTNETDLSCDTCKDCYHLECTGLKRMPRGKWVCSPCAEPKTRKRDSIALNSSDDDDTESDSFIGHPSKRPRRSKQKDDLSKNNNNSRRMRRTDDVLPLDTIALYNLLDKIMKHADAWPFLRPVSQSEVPDYHKIIKTPMDFARIKSNLNMCRYTTNEDVINDIQLVFRNCDMYNSQGNDIYRAGASLEHFVAAKCEALNLSYTPSDMMAEHS